jgi:fumarate reductase subunit C
MATRRPYVRPMAGWWRRDPFFMRYMAREVTAVFVAAYGIVLLVGLVRLAQGEAAFAGWLAALRSPLSLAFHALLLAVFAYHTYSWFAIMPKTLPRWWWAGGGSRPARSPRSASSRR